MFNAMNAERIGNKIDIFVDAEKDTMKTASCYLRMKVEVNVNKPLLTGFWWKNSEGKES